MKFVNGIGLCMKTVDAILSYVLFAEIAGMSIGKIVELGRVR